MLINGLLDENAEFVSLLSFVIRRATFEYLGNCSMIYVWYVELREADRK